MMRASDMRVIQKTMYVLGRRHRMASEAVTVNDLSTAHNTCIRWPREPSKGFCRETM